ncbi:MAG: type I glyceraldehyde-3-phosphate dehydrogenase [Thermoanaerobaculia bacterium]|nr:type I glyceraldehyde-3-phosphate dehydrogenase [Thermoanaerobaculia bacterium]
MRVGINGFGRIGRVIMRTALKYGTKLEFVAVNDITDPGTLAYLLKYDSVHGNLENDIVAKDNAIVVDGKSIRVFAEKDPAKIPWEELGVDLVIESTGLWTKREDAAKHLRGNVKHVVISAPAKGEDITVCLGVNDAALDVTKHFVISNASCTTNCMAPMAKVLHEKFGIKKGIMTTIHSYTNDQRILDLPHKDHRRARAAALSMIPTSTGAAKAVGLVLPELKGKFDGISVRVPTPNVSLVDLVIETEKPATVEEINQAIRAAADGPMKGILAYSDEDLVSIDFKGNPASSIVDTGYTRSVDPHMHKVLSWYDNEWGYSKRVVDLCEYIDKKKA